jgi:opacity protein-like surface antigen
MESILKKVAVLVIAVTMGISANAQQGDFAAGVNGLVGFGNSYTNFGAGAKILYNVTDPIRLAGTFDYFFISFFISMWDAMAFVHYLFPLADAASIYPLAGLGVVGTSASASVEVDLGPLGGGTYGASASTTDFSFSLGAGIDFALSEKLTLNGEFKTWLKTGTRFIVSVGIAYKF